MLEQHLQPLYEVNLATTLQQRLQTMPITFWMKSCQAATSECAIGNGKRKFKAFGKLKNKLKHAYRPDHERPQSCLMPKSFIASSQVTIAAALAGNARTMVGPRPV